MELILISDSKLKIMLTYEDMRHYELDSKSMNYDNTETRKAFWNILDEVKHQTGFDAASDRVFIQMYPSKEGGCEMFVTKLGSAVGGVSDEDRTLPEAGTEGVSLSVPHKPTPTPRVRKEAYAFDCMEGMLCVCRKLLCSGECPHSAAYRDRNGRYYLILSRALTGGYTPVSEHAFIAEYAEPYDADTLELYIGEYGHILCPENAVGVLGAL